MIDVTQPIVSWLPNHSTALLSRYREGVDGIIGVSRRTGRPW